MIAGFESGLRDGVVIEAFYCKRSSVLGFGPIEAVPPGSLRRLKYRLWAVHVRAVVNGAVEACFSGHEVLPATGLRVSPKPRRLLCMLV